MIDFAVKYMNYPIFGQPLYEYLIVLGAMTLSLLAGVAVQMLWRFVLLPIARKTPTTMDVIILERTEKPVSRVVLIAGLYFSYLLCLEQFDIKPGKYSSFVNGFFFILGVVLGSWAAYAVIISVIQWYMQDIARKSGGRHMPSDFTPIIERVLKVAILGIALIMVLGYFNVNVSGLLATAGIASLAVALAAQDTIANMIGGFALMADRSFRPGDRVQLSDGQMGDVVDISLRTTRILTFDDTLLIIPNSELAKSQIVNYSYPTLRVRINQKIGVAYGSDMDKVKRVLLEVARENPLVLPDPIPVVFFTEFSESSLNVQFMFWIEDYHRKMIVLDEINMEINRRFNAEGIEIPFPQRDIHVRTMVEVPVHAKEKGNS